MTADRRTEDLLREVAPQVLAAMVRRGGDFHDAEDAVQEALVEAATTWPERGEPDNPVGWLVRVARRRLVDRYRRDSARSRREELAASWTRPAPDPPPDIDDTLLLMLRCCHPALTPASAIALTLRAVGGLTTRQIAAAYLVPEATMAQRISRAKATIRGLDEPFAMPPPDERPVRLRSVLHVLYVLFTEGHATSAGPDLTRPDLSGEAIRLARLVHAALPDEPEVGGLLALMLLTEARRPARTGPGGELVPLAEQDRSRWDHDLATEGLRVLTAALRRGPTGEYQLQAGIAGLHAEAPSHEATDWRRVLALYDRLEELTDNPVVTLNRAAAAGIVEGPQRGLAILDEVADRLGDHHRFHAVRGHLQELAGDIAAAKESFATAAAGTGNLREHHYLTTRAAKLSSSAD